MALISIPTSIGGINIPGGLLGGPLGSLYETGGPQSVHYPRNLGSSTKSHSVSFVIEEVQELGVQGIKDLGGKGVDLISGIAGGLPSTATSALSNFDTNTATESAIAAGTNLVDAASSAINDPTGAAKGVIGAVVDATNTVGTGYQNATNFFTERKGTPVAYITLYMPENFSLSSSASYDDSTTIASVAGALPIIGNVVSKFTSAMSNDATRVILNKAGYVFNPQKQMLFQGIDFRTFDMSFTFTPYSAKEAEDVSRIIKMFRKWSAPAASTAAAGMFWVPPAYFNIDFNFQGKRNPNLPRLQKCVVESVDVNYAPNGWTTHTDGAPVQTTMTVTFKEIVLVDRAAIEAGY